MAFYAWERQSLRVGNALLPFLTCAEILQRGDTWSGKLLVRYPLAGSSQPYLVALSMGRELEEQVHRNPAIAFERAESLSADFERRYGIVSPIFATARIEALRALRRATHDVPLEVLVYRAAAEALARTPLGIDPAVEEEFLPLAYKDLRLPAANLPDLAEFDAGIMLAGSAPLSAAQVQLLDAALPNRWRFVLLAGAAGAPAGIQQPAVPLPRARLDRIPAGADRDRVEATLTRWAAIREERARKAGSYANWVWTSLAAHGYLLLNPAARLIAYTDNADQAIHAAIEWLNPEWFTEATAVNQGGVNQPE